MIHLSYNNIAANNIMRYLAVFYDYECYPEPDEDIIIKKGYFDIGCGGSMDYYILSEYVEPDCVPYNDERYAICWTVIDDCGFIGVKVSNDNKLTNKLHDILGNNLGQVSYVDLEKNITTCNFNNKIPQWK